MNFALNLAFNSTSLGSASFAIAREIYNRGLSPSIFPIGQVDISAQAPDNEFMLWLQSGLNKAPKHHKRNNPSFKLWHLNSAIDGFSKKQGLYFFHESDIATDEEINAVNNQEVCFTSSKFTQRTFNDGGALRIVYCPLGFDSHNFKKITDKEFLGKDVIVFSLMGKMEERKNTLRIIKLWAKKFGNNPKFRLDCLVFNPFLRPEDQETMIINTLEGKRYNNIKFLPFLPENSKVNDFMNHAQIDLTGLSGCEGFNLPLFNMLCLGKHAVVLDAHVHKDYANSKNSILVKSATLKPAADGIFFHPGQKFNQGNWHEFNDEEAIAAMEIAATKAHTPNPDGEKLKETFTYNNTVNIILDNLQKV